jgi:DNA polymerase/3'-5' exonuclease PolX
VKPNIQKSIIKSGDPKLHYDIFLTTPEKWGVIFTLRTGCSDFSHRLVTPKREGGLCPSNYHVKDGRIWWLDQPFETPEEADVFRILGLDWIDPERRTQ